MDDLPLRNLSTFEIPVWLNNLVEQKGYSDSVVRSCFNNIRVITHLARKQKFLAEDPGEDVTMPITKLTQKPVLGIDLMFLLLGAIEDLGDLCPDPSPEAPMFPTFGRGKRKGQAVPRHAKNFLKWRIRPIAERLGKKTRSFHVYQMSSDEDYFYIDPNSVLLGFLGAVMAILLSLIFATWIGYKIW